MGSYHQTLYQIVFATKYREPILRKEQRALLFQYMAGIVWRKNCHVHAINGIEDHVHIVTSLHPSVCVADLVKDVKVGSHYFIKENNLFRGFYKWQEGYGAFTYGQSAKRNLIRYVKNQEEHHKKETSRSELIRLLEEHQVVYDLSYLE